jgi:hypothetical protein
MMNKHVKSPALVLLKPACFIQTAKYPVVIRRREGD